MIFIKVGKFISNRCQPCLFLPAAVASSAELGVFFGSILIAQLVLTSVLVSELVLREGNNSQRVSILL